MELEEETISLPCPWGGSVDLKYTHGLGGKSTNITDSQGEVLHWQPKETSTPKVKKNVLLSSAATVRSVAEIMPTMDCQKESDLHEPKSESESKTPDQLEHSGDHWAAFEALIKTHKSSANGRLKQNPKKVGRKKKMTPEGIRKKKKEYRDAIKKENQKTRKAIENLRVKIPGVGAKLDKAGVASFAVKYIEFLLGKAKNVNNDDFLSQFKSTKTADS